MKVTADFTKITGRIKPMHGVGQPPVLGIDGKFMHWLGEAGIPYSRLHDVGGPYGGGRFVDIPNIFRNFDADENLPESYDFTFTDWLLAELDKQHCEPFYRLGVTIENAYEMKAYYIYPPKDFAKWARICEHIIRHYNEGWADGFRYGIRYWEIWNEPDGRNGDIGGAMWLGTKADYFRLYDITSKHLKSCFGDSIKVGGYATCGFYAYAQDPDCISIENPQNNYEWWIQYAHDFLKFVRENNCPMDFFSWHSYAQPEDLLAAGRYCRRMLDKYGFNDVEDICNEWNPTPNAVGRSTALASAKIMAVMLGTQKQSTSVLCFYDARIGSSQYGGLFNPDTWKPYLSYYAMMSFNRLYALQNEVETSADGTNVYVGGATDGNRSVLVIANLNKEATTVDLALSGVSAADAEMFMLDEEHAYCKVDGKPADTLTLPAGGFVEIRF